MASATANPPVANTPGTPARGAMATIGRFRIIKVLGKGAQGVVYLGLDPNLDREVAIKTLDAYRNISPERKDRLIREARTVSKLKHPNVVPLYEAGQVNGRPFLVFEHVEGGSLKDLMAAESPLPIHRAAALMTKVLAGIASAHEAGIIHKDLTPANVLVERDDTPRIMDFGISVVMGDTKNQSGEMSGTVNYMSPEHTAKGALGPAADIFSLGLIFYEMLAGRPAFAGENAYSTLYKIAYEPAPALSSFNANVDDKLERIIFKALEKDPGKRYASANQMKADLEAYLSTGDDQEGAAPTDSNSAVEFILKRMRYKKDFPTFSSNVIEINKKASVAGNNLASAADLSRVILKDFSLTNKLLRLVNSAFYGQFAGKITTVSRAVVVLGFEEVRMAAASLMLFDHIQNKSQREDLKDASIKAFMSGVIAKEISDGMHMKGAEEALVCAMLHNLGRHLAAFYLPEEHDEIKKRMIQKNQTEKHASKAVLGVSFEELGMAVAKNWSFPDRIVNTLRTLPPGDVERPKTPEEMLLNLSNLSNEVCEAVSNSQGEDRSKVLEDIARRYKKSVPLSEKKILSLLKSAKETVANYSAILDIDVQKSPFLQSIGDAEPAAIPAGAGSMPGLPGQAGLAGGAMGAPGILSPEPSLSDTQERVNVLITGIQEVTNAMLEDYKLNDLMFMVLETMYRGFGFQRVLFAIKDVSKKRINARFGFGLDIDVIMKKFSFEIGNLAAPQDVFQLCLAQKQDMRIDDAHSPQLSGKIPKWYVESVFAPAFALYPLVINNVCIGLFYMDRDMPGVVIGQDHHNYLKTLRNQAVMAIRQARR